MEHINKCVICNQDFDYGKHKEKQTCSKDCLKILKQRIGQDEAITLKRVEKFKATFAEKFGPRESNCVTCGKLFDTGKHKDTLNCSPECYKIYRDEHKDERIQKTYDAIKEKHGVDHPSKIPGFANKVKKTKKEKYGDENYTNREQTIKTNLERYGVEVATQLPEIQDKIKQTKKEKYGDENYNNREQAAATILDTYGVIHHLQLPEFIDKMRHTNQERYNTDYTILTPEAKESRKNKNIELYGTEFYFNSEEHLQRQSDKATETIKRILKENDFSFNIDEYTQQRFEDEDGTLHYYEYNIICNKCNTSFKSALNGVIPICRTCNPFSNTSNFQIEFRDFLTSLNISFDENTRKIISPLELDFYFGSEKIAIELNGNYYHSELSGQKNKHYHLNKTKLCDKQGIKLIHIFEDEWVNKKSIVKSEIKSLFNKNEIIINAEDCVVNDVSDDEKECFMQQNHIHGNLKDSIKYGLFHNNELVYVMTFSMCNKKSTHNFELNRFGSKINYSVIGAFDKLLNYFIQNNNFESITSFADCRWDGLVPDSTVYGKHGFKFISRSRPEYFYMKITDYYHRFHRFSCNKQTLLKEFKGDPLKSEWELAQENGFDRIWDCGKMKFELKSENAEKNIPALNY